MRRSPAYAGTVISITLLGWGIGGVCGGVFADYFGRKRTMIYAILAYSLLTGLTAFSFNWISFALLRFLVGIAIGSEWATGSSMMAELWPQNARGKGAGLMQCGLGIGFFLASFIWLFVSGFGPDAWRYMFVIGILPALLTVWIRTSIDESEVWQATDAQRREARARKESGAVLTAEEQGLDRFTVADLFAEPETRAAHHPGVPDVAHHDAGVVGHLVLGAALYRVGRHQSRPAGRAMGELCRHGL